MRHSIFVTIIVILAAIGGCDDTNGANTSNNISNNNNTNDGGVDGDIDGDVEEPEILVPDDFGGAWAPGGYTLSWIDTNSADVTYQIEKKSQDASEFETMSELSGDATSFTDDAADKSSPALYRIRAYLGNDFSEWAECDAKLKPWTYIRVVGYDSLWGDEGPDMTEVVAHLSQDMIDFKGDENLNLVFLGDSYGDNGSRYAYIDPETGVELIDKPELNTGDVQTYRDFFDWVVENFPAQKYAISYWSHGSGSISMTNKKNMKSIGFDDGNNDELTADETGEVLDYLKSITGKKVEVMFACSCLTQMVGNLYPLRDSLRYMVAGESTVGCNTDVLDTLSAKPWWSAKEIAVENSKNQRSSYPKDVVYSAAKSDESGELAILIDNLAITLMDFASNGTVEKSELRNAAEASENMGYLSTPDYIDTFIDLYDYCNQLILLDNTLISSDAQSIKDFLDSRMIFDLTIQSDADGLYKKAHGVSIYHPLESYYDYYYFNVYDSLKFSRDTNWNEFIKYIAP